MQSHMRSIGLIERAAKHFEAEIDTSGDCHPGGDPQQQQADSARQQCRYKQYNRQGQHQLIARSNTPSLCQICNERLAEQPIWRYKDADKWQHCTEADQLGKNGHKH